jgi:hypothetical protein
VTLEDGDVTAVLFPLATGFTNLSAVNSEKKCECCLKLKQELIETLRELSSEQKIIQLLQEDANSEPRYNDASTTNQDMNFVMVKSTSNTRNRVSSGEQISPIRIDTHHPQPVPTVIN